ncbi:MAG: gliding motility-associated C-terminal domain-containing protein, partial [Flammeovirgaceae bacterium]
LGCTAVAVVTSTLPTPPTISANLCTNPATLTTSTIGTSYKWTLFDNTTETTAVPTLNLPLTARTGTYKVEVTLPSGCVVSGSTSITYNGPLTPTVSQNNNGCASSAILTVIPSGNYTYRWTRNGVPILGGNQISITNLDDGIAYSVQVVDAISGCTQVGNITAKVSGPVDAFITATQACDDGKDFTLTATTTALGVTYSWFFNNSTTAISGATSATLNRTDAGTYRVRVSKATCSADAIIQIIKAPLPQGQLVDAVIICADNENQDPATNQVDLNPGYFATYNWFRDGSSLGYTKRIFNATSAGTYRVDLTNSFGCTNSDQTKVSDECLPKIVAPNAFRPSSIAPQYSNKFGDFTNKEFFLYSYFISDNFEIAIYNRWGELVFQSSDKDFRWNGGYNNNGGQPLPGGTYTYVVRYQSSYRPQDGVREQRGGVVLLR